MLQYRLSTLFLLFFVVATTLALFGMWVKLGSWSLQIAEPTNVELIA
jgi:hypothetical protein